MTSRASLDWIICENIEDAKRLQQDFKTDIKYGTPDQYEQALNDSKYVSMYYTNNYPSKTLTRNLPWCSR